MLFVTKTRPLTEEVGTLGSVLRVPFEAMLAHNYACIRGRGFDDIRMAHGAVFRNISGEGSRITELAARARMTKQSMAELVKYLQERGYVQLEADPNDRRSRLVRLTERGEAVFDALAEASLDYEAECSRLLGRTKWAAYKSMARDVARALEPLIDEDATPDVRWGLSASHAAGGHARANGPAGD
jgi:DNA-binding MarR family transcriptional regulator